jgi:hypothetical protein
MADVPPIATAGQWQHVKTVLLGFLVTVRASFTINMFLLRWITPRAIFCSRGLLLPFTCCCCCWLCCWQAGLTLFK